MPKEIHIQQLHYWQNIMASRKDHGELSKPRAKQFGVFRYYHLQPTQSTSDRRLPWIHSVERLRLTVSLLDRRRLPQEIRERLGDRLASHAECNNIGFHLPRMANILPHSLENIILVGHVGPQQMDVPVDGLIARKESLLHSSQELILDRLGSITARISRRLESLRGGHTR